MMQPSPARSFVPFVALALITRLTIAASSPHGFSITETDTEIQIHGEALDAAIRKKGYVSGVEGGSFIDKKTGFHDLGYGLDIVDWIMEPGSDEAYRDQLPQDLPYQFGNDWHGKRPKRSIEGSSRVDLQACKLEYSIVSPK